MAIKECGRQVSRPTSTANKCSDRQVTRLTNNQSNKYDRQVSRPTSNQADKYPDQQVPSQCQQTNISTPFAFRTSTLHLTKKQIPINDTCIIGQRGDHTPSLCKRLHVFPLTHGAEQQSCLAQKRLHAFPLTYSAEQQPYAGKTARLPLDTVQNSHHISEDQEAIRFPHNAMHNRINRKH